MHPFIQVAGVEAICGAPRSRVASLERPQGLGRDASLRRRSDWPGCGESGTSTMRR